MHSTRSFGVHRRVINSVLFFFQTKSRSTASWPSILASREKPKSEQTGKIELRCHAGWASRVSLIANEAVGFARDRRVVATCLLAMTFFSGSIAMGSTRGRGVEKRKVLFLATSSLVRGTWGYDLDTYLAEFVPANGDERLLIHLVDDYPNFAPPLSTDVLTSSSGTVLKVKRDRQCDMPITQMKLRSAPGDPIAALPVPQSYEPLLEPRPAPEAVLPCYRIIRK